MAQSDHERVGKALELLNRGLKPFVEREMQARYGKRWQYEAVKSLHEQHLAGNEEEIHLDTQGLLLIMWDQWHEVFRGGAGPWRAQYCKQIARDAQPVGAPEDV